jgi:PAS domain S-box-containing protein
MSPTHSPFSLTDAGSKKQSRIGWSANLRWMVWLLAAGWMLLIAVSLRQSWHLLQRGALEMATEEASDNLAKDKAFRGWATLHGGVYVPVTPQTPPNPLLAGLPERDLTTPSGRQLTLLNPEYMTRQIFEAETTQFGGHEHITSLKPLRPENAPDDWEAAALRAFEAGQKEVGSVGNLNGQPYYRLMRPLITEAGCLKCHGVQGYRVGEIRGGISTAVLLAPHRAVAHAQFIPIAGGHATIGVLGLVALLVAYRQTRRRLAERQQADAIILRERDFSQATLDSLPGLFYLFDDQGRFLRVNQNFAKVSGYSSNEIFRMTPLDFFGGTDKGKVADAIKRVFLTGEATVEADFVSKDQIKTPYFFTGKLFQFDQKSCLIGMGIDLTERKRAEEALRDSEALYQSLVAQLPQCVFRKDLAGRFTFTNEHFSRLLGKAPAEILGRTDFDLVPRDLAEKYRKDDLRVMQERLVWQEVEENSLPNGERIFVQVVKTPLINAGGEVVGVQGIFWDITERKRAETERERLIGELKAALAQIQTLGRLLPICSGCKKIRDDQGYWNQVDVYIRKHTGTEFTHGLCPDCIKIYFPGLEEP